MLLGEAEKVTLCDRCNFDEATHKADAEIKAHFPKYENLCDYDFNILHRYANLIRKFKAREEVVREVKGAP